MSKIINSSRAYLKLLVKTDYKDILDMFKDNEALQYIPHLQNQNDAYYLDYLDNKLSTVKNGKGYYWVARWKDDDAFIGCINVTPISEEDNRKQIGWIIKRKYWQQGLAMELASEVFKYSISDLKIPIIYGVFDKKNIASERILDRLEFKFHKEDNNVLIYKYGDFE